MLQIGGLRLYIIIKHMSELTEAKKNTIAKFIIYEDGNTIYIWTKLINKWYSQKYVLFGESKGTDLETTGFKAYQEFYRYCGKEEVERMKHILRPIELWESSEQLHYYNIEFSNIKIYDDIYVLDANSAFTYGANQLPEGFEKLKEYMATLYEKKKNATNKNIRSRYKNLQNYLIGYFARVKGLISVRSKIIEESNKNILKHMAKINLAGGKVFISNTDSIFTDKIGLEIMSTSIGDEVGKFKLEKTSDRLFYKSSNCYQIGDKITYSGVKYFARKNFDFFTNQTAIQTGSLLEGYDFNLGTEDEEYNKLCKVREGQVTVTIYNSIGEIINTKIYKIGDSNDG